jgi:multimeric flavodoxin WrbA
MGVRVVILQGSPRPKGNSSTLADRVAAGAREGGAEVESFHLHSMDIRPCRGCDACLKTGVCAVKDDMRTLGPKLRAADAIVLASPVYWFTMSAQLKTCMDRWYALWHPDNDFLKGKKIGIVLAYGDTNLVTSGGRNAIATIKSAASFLDAEIVGCVHGSLNAVGDAQKNPRLMASAFRLGKKLAQTKE